MLVSENSSDSYRAAIKISMGAIIKNLAILRFVPDHLKIKKMCKNAVRKLQFIIRYVPDWYKIKEMCDEVILEYGGILGFVPDCHKKLFDKVIKNYYLYIKIWLGLLRDPENV